MPAKPFPDRYHTITPYLVVEGAAQVIVFMVRVCNGKVFERMAGPTAR